MTADVSTKKGPCPYCDSTAKIKGKEKHLLVFAGDLNAVACKDHIFTVIEQQTKKE